MHNQKVVVGIPHGAANNITQHFVPNPVNINDGNTIEWINEDTIIHIVNGVKDMAIDDIKLLYIRSRRDLQLYLCYPIFILYRQ